MNSVTHVNGVASINDKVDIVRPLPINNKNKRQLGGTEQKITKYIMQGNGSVNPISERQNGGNTQNGLLKDLIT